MSSRGVVFDFNGTLYWDTALHNRAWDLLLARHDRSLSDAEKHLTLHGKNNREILRGIFGEGLSDGRAEDIAAEKEAIYRDLCLRSPMELAPGAVDFIEFLRATGIPYTIATASSRDNVDFYFQELDLDRWFDRDRIVFNDGTIPSKPNPKIFLTAIRRLGVQPGDTMIFEDSFTGIRAAERAGAAEVIIVNSNNEDYSGFTHRVITDFSHVDRNRFGGIER